MAYDYDKGDVEPESFKDGSAHEILRGMAKYHVRPECAVELFWHWQTP